MRISDWSSDVCSSDLVPDDAGLQEPDQQEMYSDAQEIVPGIEVGDYIEESLEPEEFGRIGAQAAKQAILQKIRDAEREQVLNDFLERGENIVSGTVKRIDRKSTRLNSSH